jgi:hypothetical protein
MFRRNVTVQEVENVQIDSGIIYVNYVAGAKREIGLTKGGSEFSVKQEIRQIEHDGAMGDEKGMARITKVEAKIKCSLLAMILENLKLALPGTTLENSVLSGATTGVIAEEDYVNDLTIIGQTVAGFKRITIFNALGSGSISIKSKDKDEAAFDVEMSGTFDPQDSTQSMWEIEDLESYPGNLSNACLVVTSTIPASATIGADTITANVVNGTSSITINVAPSTGATWKLYSNVNCTTEIANKVWALSVGANTTYIKVIAEDKATSKIYAVTVTRAA